LWRRKNKTTDLSINAWQTSEFSFGKNCHSKKAFDVDAANKSLDASGGGLFLNLIRPAMLD
jgi:hypothetical protein